MLIWILGASLIGSLLALIGGFFLVSRESSVRKHSLTLVSFAAGSLLGAAFLEVLPEAVAESSYESIAPALLAGVLVMFLFEKMFHWYHCHTREACDTHPAVDTRSLPAALSVGDGIHNFIDGIVIALAFTADIRVGLTTTLAVFFHELPQEMGDFGVMLHAGWEKKKVLFVNFLTQLTAPLGALVAYFFLLQESAYLGPLLGFSAGTFIYISVSDLLPELRHKTEGPDFGHIFSLLFGVVLIWALGVYLPE